MGKAAARLGLALLLIATFFGGRATSQSQGRFRAAPNIDEDAAMVTIPTIENLPTQIPGVVPPLWRWDLGDHGSYVGTNIYVDDSERRPGSWGRSRCELTDLAAFEPLECWGYKFSQRGGMDVFPGISVTNPVDGHLDVLIRGGAPAPYIRPGERQRNIRVEFAGGRPTIYYLSLDVVCFRTPDGQDRSLDIKTEAIGPPGPICNLWNGSRRL